jgi:hypothetical protein
MKKKVSLPTSLRVILIQPNDKLVYAGYKRNLTRRTPLGLAYKEVGNRAYQLNE